MFFLVVLINFIVIVVLVRTIVARFMGFMGVNFYDINVGGRFVMCLVLAVVLALLETA